jgi:hypothetical protein
LDAYPRKRMHVGKKMADIKDIRAYPLVIRFMPLQMPFYRKDPI